MRRFIANLQWLIVFAVICLTTVSELKFDAQTKEILQQADNAALTMDLNHPQNQEQDGHVESNISNWNFSTTQLQARVAQLPLSRKHQFYTWSTNGDPEVTGSASGVDELAYFANSFLVGFKPFTTKSVWEPLATLALRKNYILDHQLYGPELAEVWQNSRQAYKYTRGDCEDHAIILADWLIAQGHDARVVLGKYNNGGHAWVVLEYQGNDYVLESTSKRRPRNVNDFLLARLATAYQPIYQFDRENFWVNTGSSYTTKYRDAKWELRSKFVRSG